MANLRRSGLGAPFFHDPLIAVKHGDDKKIIVSLSLKEKHLLLQITNSCTHAETQQTANIQGGNGIPNMTRRVHNLNGHIEMQHANGHHTITITI